MIHNRDALLLFNISAQPGQSSQPPDYLQTEDNSEEGKYPEKKIEEDGADKKFIDNIDCEF